MELRLTRQKSRAESMRGHLSVLEEGGGVVYECETLEDEAREVKVAGETAIPAGTYTIKLRPLGESRLDEGYERRYGDVGYRGQLWLQDVPGFTYVYIHVGNTDDDTDGCILVGETGYRDAIGRSRAAYRALYPLVADAIDAGEVSITITDAAA